MRLHFLCRRVCKSSNKQTPDCMDSKTKRINGMTISAAFPSFAIAMTQITHKNVMISNCAVSFWGFPTWTLRKSATSVSRCFLAIGSHDIQLCPILHALATLPSPIANRMYGTIDRAIAMIISELPNAAICCTASSNGCAIVPMSSTSLFESYFSILFLFEKPPYCLFFLPYNRGLHCNSWQVLRISALTILFLHVRKARKWMVQFGSALYYLYFNITLHRSAGTKFIFA